jgi:hypothetical protein
MLSEMCEAKYAPKAVAREYMRDMALAGIVYMAAVFGGVYAIKNFEPPQWLAIVLALAPVAPVLLMLRAYLRFLGRVDEFQRRVQSESMLIAACIVGFACMTYGFLESFAGLPTIPGALLWVFPAMIGIWGVAQIFVRRRYQ